MSKQVFNYILILLLSFPLIVSASDYTEAEKAFNQQDYKLALIHLKNYIKQQPKDAQARLLIGKTYVKLNNFLGADKELSKAYKLDSRDAEILLAHTSILLLKKEFEMVRKILDKPFSNKENESERLVILALTYLNEEKIADAKDYFSKAKEIKNTNEVKIGMAKVALIENNVKKAERIVNQILEKAPKYQDALFLKATIAYSHARYQEALSLYSQLDKQLPGNTNILLKRAATYIALKDYSNAEKDTKRVITIDSNNVYANYLQSFIEYQTKNYVKASQTLQKVLTISADYYPAMYLSGVVNFTLKHYNQAEKYLLQYTSKYPDDLSAQNSLANLYITIKEGEQALLILETIAPDKLEQNPELLKKLGTAYLLTGQNEKGLAALKKAGELSPKDLLIKERMVTGYLQSGDMFNAISGLEQLAAQENKKNTKYMLITTYIQEKQYDKALSRIKDFLQKTPSDPNLYNFQAVIAVLNKDYTAAKNYYMKALQIDKNYLSAYLGLAQLALKSEQYKEADQNLQKVIAIKPDFVKAYVYRAGIAQIENNEALAISILENALSTIKKDISRELFLASFLSKLYVQQSQEQQLLNLGRKMAVRYPADYNALAFQAQTLIAGKKYKQAVDVLSRIILENKMDITQRFQLVNVLLELKKEQAAIDILNEILNIYPENTEALIHKTKLLIQIRDYPQALKVSKKLQQLVPEKGIGYHFSGNIYLAMKQKEKALDAFINAYRNEANNRYLFIAADLMMELKQTNEAISLLKQAITEDEKNIAVHLKLALYFQNNEMNTQAIKYYEAVLSYQPENILALNNLAWIYSIQGNSKALELARQAYKLKPESAAIMDTYGEVLMAQKQYARGLEILKKATSVAPEAMEIQFHLARAYHLNQKNRRAREILTNILASEKSFKGKEEAVNLLKQLQ